jgi:hypothetical protein
MRSATLALPTPTAAVGGRLAEARHLVLELTRVPQGASVKRTVSV